MNKKSYILTLLCFIIYSISFCFCNEQKKPDNIIEVYTYKIDSEINDSLYLFLNKSLTRLLEQKDKKQIYIIFEFDTPGGELGATLNIIKLFDKVNDEGVNTVGYVNTKALSAGAIIALSCKKLYMASGSTIGSAAPILMTPFGLVQLGEYKEKIVSAIRSTIKSRSQKYNRPSLILEAMVDDSFDIYKVTFENGEIAYMRDYEITNAEQNNRIVIRKELIKPKDKLINLTDKEAYELGVSNATVSSIDEIIKLEKLLISASAIMTLQKGPEDYFISFLELGIVASILSMIGLGALFTFFKTGSITALIIAICCLSFTPLVKAIVGLSGPIALYLILLGIVLVLVEVFVIPGTSIIGLLGILTILVGIIMNFGSITPPEIPRIVGFSSSVLLWTSLTLMGSLVLFLLAIKLLPAVPVVNTLILGGGLTAKAVDEVFLQKIKIGDEGITVSECKPIGLVDFGGNLVECEVIGEFLKRNSEVVVVNIQGNKIYIKRKEQ
jgi:membrane-bound serine protease (ClpP class)